MRDINETVAGKSGIKSKIKTLTASTNGKGYYTDQAKKVRITEIRISRYVRSKNKPLLQMEVYFNTKDWNTKKDDLIYGDEKWISELRKGLQSIGFIATGLDYTEQGMQEDDFVSVETSNKAAVESFLSKLVNKNQIKDIETGFDEAADEELDEANWRLRKPKPHEEVYYKWFEGVEVSIMDMSKISKEIQAALDSKADLDKVMPELVKKYGKNSPTKKEEFEEDELDEAHQSGSFAAFVKTKGDSTFTSTNALRFRTEAEAKQYGENLRNRWLAVTEIKVMPSTDKPNYEMVNNVAKPIKESSHNSEEFEELVMESDPTELELREFLTQLTYEEVTILRNIINETR